MRNGIYKKKEFHGSGQKIVNMGELFAYPRLGDVPMRRLQLSAKEKNRFCLLRGDLLFARRSLVAEGAGKCSVVLDVPETTTFESSIIRARPDPAKADSQFLYYYFNAPPGLHALDTIRRHVAVAGITGRDLVNVQIRLPSLPEQRAIAGILGTLDEKIELNRRMNETLEAMVRALFKSWFVDFEPVRAKMERRDTGLPEKISGTFPDRLIESEIGQVPAGWNVSQIGNEVRVSGGSTPSTKNLKYWDNGTFHWATPKDLSKLYSPVLLDTGRKITHVGVESISSGLLPIGTVLMSSRAPIGYLAIAEVPTAVNQGFIAMVCDKHLPNLFVLFWCQENLNHIKGVAGGSTFAEISKKAFRPILVAVPDESILENFASIVHPLYERIVANVREANLLSQLRDLLLPNLISGEIRPRDLETVVSAIV